MGKRTGEPKPARNPLVNLCVTGRYLWLDLSLLFNCPEGIGTVATYAKDGRIVCLFNWDFPYPWEKPGGATEAEERDWFGKVIELPWGQSWSDLYQQAQTHNAAYKKWVES